MNGISVEDKPRSTVSLNFDDNSKLTEMFTGTGLGDEVSLLVTGKVTRLDEFGVGMLLLQIGEAEKSDETDADVVEADLESEPVNAVLNVVVEEET